MLPEKLLSTTAYMRARFQRLMFLGANRSTTGWRTGAHLGGTFLPAISSQFVQPIGLAGYHRCSLPFFLPLLLLLFLVVILLFNSYFLTVLLFLPICFRFPFLIISCFFLSITVLNYLYELHFSSLSSFYVSSYNNHSCHMHYSSRVDSYSSSNVSLVEGNLPTCRSWTPSEPRKELP